MGKSRSSTLDRAGICLGMCSRRCCRRRRRATAGEGTPLRRCSRKAAGGGWGGAWGGASVDEVGAGGEWPLPPRATTGRSLVCQPPRPVLRGDPFCVRVRGPGAEDKGAGGNCVISHCSPIKLNTIMGVVSSSKEPSFCSVSQHRHRFVMVCGKGHGFGVFWGKFSIANNCPSLVRARPGSITRTLP
jgi:hypothetical protein